MGPDSRAGRGVGRFPSLPSQDEASSARKALLPMSIWPSARKDREQEAEEQLRVPDLVDITARGAVVVKNFLRIFCNAAVKMVGPPGFEPGTKRL